MAAAQENFDHDIDVGRAGLTGHYDHLTTSLRGSLPGVILTIGVWIIVLRLPSSWDAQLAPDISLRAIFLLAVLIWTAKVWWPLLYGLYFGAKWLMLEGQGVEWVVRNDHALRVTYYRCADKSIQFDETPRAQRLNQELQAAQYRKSTLMRSGIQLFAWFAAYIAAPLAFAYLYELLNSDARDFLDRWNAIGAVRWLMFYFLIVPQAVAFLLSVFEIFVYHSGAQFIPGAQLTDPVIREKTMETMREQQTHGAADFVSPDDAAQQMAK